MPDDTSLYPVLLLPSPASTDAPARNPVPPPSINLPDPARQGARLTGRFRDLARQFETRFAEFRRGPDGEGPEDVVVLETIGAVEDFLLAVQRVPGLEWMAEVEQNEIPPNEDFFNEDDGEALLKGRVYLVMSNQAAMVQLLRLWNEYIAAPEAPLPYGFGRFKEAFRHLRTVRLWGVQDRLDEAGVMQYWREQLEYAPGRSVRFEAELWYRDSEAARRRSHFRFAEAVTSQGGRILHQCTIPEIRFDGLLLELPNTSVEEFLRTSEAALLRSSEVMFFRPLGQFSFKAPSDPPLQGDPRVAGQFEGSPVLALLDGLPVENHQLLAGGLQIDDPEGWGATYPAALRQHGTAMASLILNGEADAPENPLRRPVYVRPVMKPDHGQTPPLESTPDNHLAIDLLHRAVRRMFEGEHGNAPAAPNVRVINLSIGDRHQPFDRHVSPWGRLLDWLAWRFNVLFVVSAGNHVEPLELDVERAQFRAVDTHRLRQATLQALERDIRKRRLLSPAEAINVVTVGALHSDRSPPRFLGNLTDPFAGVDMVSPINSVGFGFRGALKPEILMAGGRQLFTERMGTTHPKAILDLFHGNGSPGQKVASPGAPGDTNAVRYCRGTSNAAALTTRAAGKLIENLEAVHGTSIPSDFYPVIVKAMLIHGASWGNEYSLLAEILRGDRTEADFRKHAGRFMGYGSAAIDRVLNCAEHRGTVLGWGAIRAGQKHDFRVPLPLSLNGRRLWRRAILTLAWFTPINPRHRQYRQAALVAEQIGDILNVSRQNCDWRDVRKGTVQHEVFEGESASAFSTEDSLRIQVICREEAGRLRDEIRYALVITEEVAEGNGVRVYNELRQQLRVGVAA